MTTPPGGGPPGGPPGTGTPPAAPATPPAAPAAGAAPAGMTEAEITRTTNLYRDLIQTIKDYNDVTEELREERELETTTLEKKQEIELRLLEIQREKEVSYIKLGEAARLLGREREEELEQLARAAELDHALLNGAKKTQEVYKEYKKLLEKLKDEQKQFNDGLAQGQGAWDTLAKSIGVVDDKYSKFFESMQTKKGLSGLLEGLQTGFSKSFSVAKVAAFFVETAVSANVKLFNDMDKAQANFKKNFTGQFADSVIAETNKFEKELRTAGVSYEESLGARTEIASSYSLYEEASDEMRNSLAKDAALMAKSGITNNQYTESIDSMVMSLGMSEESAMQNIRKFTVLSSVLRKSKTQIMTDFKSMSNYLSQFGSQSIKVFTDLEAVSTKTGLSMEKITAVTEKFSTFGGAADAVGRLNAILGPSGLLNPLEVFQEMDPAKQFMMLFDAIKRAGIDMNKPQNRFIFKELGNITGLQTEDIKRVLTALNKGKGSLEEIRQAIENVGEVSDQMVEDQARSTRNLNEKKEDLKAQQAAGAGTVQKGLDLSHGAMNFALETTQNNPSAFFSTGAALTGANMLLRGQINAAEAAGLAGVAGSGATEVSGLLGSVVSALSEASTAASRATGVWPRVSAFFSALRAAPATAAVTSAATANPAIRFMPAIGGFLNLIGAWMEYEQNGFTMRTGANLVAGLSGIASAVPGPHVPIAAGLALGINGLMAAYDLGSYLFSSEESPGESSGEQTSVEPGTEAPPGAPARLGFATGGIITKEITNASLGERNRSEAVIPLQDGSNHLAEPLYIALEKFATSNKGSGANVVPNIKLTVVLDGNELKSYVKNVIGETLNPFT